MSIMKPIMSGIMSPIISPIIGEPVSLTPKWDADLAATKAGTKDTRTLFVGDSTMIGAVGNGTHYRPNETKAFANILAANGTPSNDSAFFGTSDFTTAKRLYKDLRLTGTFTMYSAAALGGFMAQGTSIGQTLTFTPETACDTFRVFYWGNGSSTSTVQATGGTPVTVANNTAGVAFGTTALRYLDVTAGSLASGNSVTITFVSGSLVPIAAIEAWDSTQKQVINVNAGHYGSSTPNWIVTGASNRAPLDILQGFPDGYYSFVVIKPGINDAGNSRDIETVYKPNLRTMINAIGTKADIIIEACNPISSLAELPYNVANREIADEYGLLFVNNRLAPDFDTYSNAVSAGLMGDTLHPNSDGLTLVGEYLYNQIVN